MPYTKYLYVRNGLLQVLLFCCRSISAQSPILKNFTIKDCLPGNEIYTMCLDSKGFIWIYVDAGRISLTSTTVPVQKEEGGLVEMTDESSVSLSPDKRKILKKGSIWFEHCSQILTTCKVIFHVHSNAGGN